MDTRTERDLRTATYAAAAIAGGFDLSNPPMDVLDVLRAQEEASYADALPSAVDCSKATRQELAGWMTVGQDLPKNPKALDNGNTTGGPVVTYALAFDVITRKPVPGDVIIKAPPRTLRKDGRLAPVSKYATEEDRKAAAAARRREARARKALDTLNRLNVPADQY